jgi:5-oxoprolinase (ATP-hydrolysing)
VGHLLIEEKGDRLIIETPGGGAWGALDDDGHGLKDEHRQEWAPRGSLDERQRMQAGF